MRIPLFAFCLALTMCGCAIANDPAVKQPTGQQQFTLIDPNELQSLKAAATAGYNKKSIDTLRHMYTAAALTGLLASPNVGPMDVAIGNAKEIGKRMVEGIEEKK